MAPSQLESLESRVLLSGTFAGADIADTWTFAGSSAAGSIAFDDSGHISGGALTFLSNTSSTPSGTYLLNTTGALDLNGNFDPVTGAMAASRDVIAVASSANGSDLAILLNSSGATFSNGDLSGIWQVALDGDVPGSNGLGRLVFDGNGAITGGKISTGGSALSITAGTYTLDANGSLTAHITLKTGKTTTSTLDFGGALNASKDVLALSPLSLSGAIADDQSRLVVAVRTSGKYTVADAAGTWTIATDHGVGTLTLDPTKKITAGVLTGQDGVQNVTGTWSISSKGAVSLHLVVDGAKLKLTGSLDASRSTLVINRLSKVAGDNDNLAVLVKSTNHAPTLTSISGVGPATAGEDLPITFGDLLSASNAADVDGDPITFQITPTGVGTLTLNSNPVVGTTPFAFGPEDVLDWTPAAGAKGTLVPFTVKAFDGADFSAAEVSSNITTVLPPTVTLTTSGSASETNDGVKKGVAFFTFKRANGDLSDELTLTYDITGSAESGTDFVPLFGTVTFEAGATTATVPVVASPDNLAEGPETVILTLEDEEGVTFTNNNATITIADSAPTISVVAKKPSASEVNNGTSTGVGQFTISRVGGDKSEDFIATVQLEGTADSSDYTLSLPTPIVIPAGKTSVTVTLVPTDDFETEPAETVILALAPDGSFFADSARGQATVTIADHNRAPALSATPTPLAGPLAGTAFDFHFEDIVFATGAIDPEGEPLSFTITKIFSGTLTLNGDPIVAGTSTVHADDVLTWTPPADASGETLAAFAVTVSDGVNVSKPITISAIVV
jgi:hypothetical protein